MNVTSVPVPAALSSHLERVEGLIFVTELTQTTEPAPERFRSEQLTPDGPTWHTLVTGLETNRFRMRERFESSLDAATPKDRSWLAHALLACYSGLYGFRLAGPERAGFEAWVHSLPEDMVAKPADSSEMGDTSLSDVVTKTGCQVLPLRSNIGHVPVGHDLLLYRLAELSPPLSGALFLETPSFEKERPAKGTEGAYRLAAWTNDRMFETSARFFEDNYDAAAVVGFLNSLSRACEYPVRFVQLGDIVCAGSVAQIREAQKFASQT